MDTREQEIIIALQELPRNIQHAVEIFPWTKEVLEIAENNNLQIDEASLFQQETMRVVVGLRKTDHYKQDLMHTLGIDADHAESLVYDANTRIFKTLQKLAFTENSLSGVGHEELADDMHEEGVRLIDHDEDLTIDDPKLEENQVTEPAGKVDVAQSYLEEISNDDLRGVHGHRIDTEILNTKTQSSPVSILEDKELPKETTEKQIIPTQTLEKVLGSSLFLSKGDRVDTSPSEIEEVREEGAFLNHLKNKK